MNVYEQQWVLKQDYGYSFDEQNDWLPYERQVFMELINSREREIERKRRQEQN